MKLEILRQIFEKIQMLNFMKIRPLGAELLRADRQMDRRRDRHVEANILFSQFCELVFGVFGEKSSKNAVLNFDKFSPHSAARELPTGTAWVKACTGTNKYFIFFFFFRNIANALYEDYIRFTHISNVTS
jgi:hypothetical protein